MTGRCTSRARALSWALAMAACLAALACGERRCSDAACDDPTGRPAQDAPASVMRSAHYRIALGPEPTQRQEARSEHYRVQISLDPARVGGER